jgi:5-formaminoimidazole-4-carboxamide-1-beta-D-ribofuranosyl 5'-monophosphate synthetase
MVFELGDDLQKGEKGISPGIIDHFPAGIVTPELDIVVYDVSLRVPGNQ